VGWELATLGDLIRLEYGKALRQRDCVGIGGVAVMGSNGQTAEHNERLAKGPGIVVGRKGSAGKVTWVDSDFWASDTTFYVVPKRDLELKWLYYALQNAQLERLIITTGVPGLNRDDAYKVSIGVPPIEEQRRIAHLLDEADRLQRLRKEANEKAQRILPALFLQMFGDPQTNPMGWQVKPLGDVCEMKSGGTPSCKNHGYYGGNVPWVKIGDLDVPDGIVVRTEECITDAGLSAIRGRRFPEGTVLLAMYASVGKTALAGIPLSMNQAILGMKPDESVLHPMYLWQYLRASQSAFIAKVNEGTQKNISATIVRAHPIALPPIDLQRTFARACAEAVEIHGRQATASTAQSAAIATLRSRLFSFT